MDEWIYSLIVTFDKFETCISDKQVSEYLAPDV